MLSTFQIMICNVSLAEFAVTPCCTHSCVACHVQAALQLSDAQVDVVCGEYMAMMERCHSVYAEQQELLAGLADFRRPSADWTGDPVRYRLE